METGFPEGFIDIDIAQAGDDGLIQKERLEQPFTGCQRRLERCDIERGRQRFDPQMAQYGVRIRNQEYTSELARVVKSQFAGILEFEDHMFVPGPFRTSRGQVQATRHSQVYQQVPGWGEIHHNEFPPPSDGGDFFRPDNTLEVADGGRRNRPWPVYPGAGESCPDQVGRIQVVDQGLNFG